MLVYDNDLIGNNRWDQDFYPYGGSGTPGSGDGTPDVDQNLFWNDDGIRLTGRGNAAFNKTRGWATACWPWSLRFRTRLISPTTPGIRTGVFGGRSLADRSRPLIAAPSLPGGRCRSGATGQKGFPLPEEGAG